MSDLKRIPPCMRRPDNDVADEYLPCPASVPVEALKDIHTRWSENLLDDWEVCIEIKTLIDQAERREES